MADIVIFGATTAGAQLKASLPEHDRVVCFADHDRERAGSSFAGSIVAHPAALLGLSYDRVMLAGQDFAGNLTFLLKLGIPLEKIDGGGVTPRRELDSRPTAVIVGSQIAAMRTLNHIDADYQVLCFCDQDASRQGKRLAGRFVVAPADLCTLSFDRIFIGTEDTYQAVHHLLWYFNIPLDKMDVAPEAVLFPPAVPRQDSRPRAVIFGAGSSGEMTFHRLKGANDIVAFIDNNPAKHGTQFCGRPVEPATALLALDFDRVVVGSMFASEIMQQLTQLGVDASKIMLPEQAEAAPSPVAKSAA